MKKIAIIGASYLQEPLITKARMMGLQTHVFAWETGDVGEKCADYFYPISIVEKEKILEKCQEINIDGICTIASDLAAITVSYVAEKLGLSGNPYDTALVSTNKHMMRKCFEKNGDPSPKSILVDKSTNIDLLQLTYPVIVKPTDRSGSRGITKVDCRSDMDDAVKRALEEGFEEKALIEEFVTGKEYSVEAVSWQGKHHILTITEKYTTGEPNFVETGHVEPSGISEIMEKKVYETVEHALNSLGIMVGASHSEIKISDEGQIKIIEIGGRMGGDFIGSHLVELSTGIDFVKAVIQCALGEMPRLNCECCKQAAAIRFAFGSEDVNAIKKMIIEHSEQIVQYEINSYEGKVVTDSSNRWGYCIVKGDSREEVIETIGFKKYEKI